MITTGLFQEEVSNQNYPLSTPQPNTLHIKIQLQSK